jgi:hypothetical protein
MNFKLYHLFVALLVCMPHFAYAFDTRMWGAKIVGTFSKISVLPSSVDITLSSNATIIISNKLPGTTDWKIQDISNPGIRVNHQSGCASRSNPAKVTIFPDLKKISASTASFTSTFLVVSNCGSAVVKVHYIAKSQPTLPPTTHAPTTKAPTTHAPTTKAPTTKAPTTQAPTTKAPTTKAPTTQAPTTKAPTTQAPTTKAPTTPAPTTPAPSPTPPPENVTATAFQTFIEVQWTENPDTSVVTYNIYRTSSPITSVVGQTVLTSVASPGTSFEDTSVTAGQLYCYSVVAVSSNGKFNTSVTSACTMIDVQITGLDAENDGPVIVGQTITFFASVATGTEVTYSWLIDMGGQNEALVGQNVSVVATTPGTFVAEVDATNNANSVSAVTQFTVEAL